VFFNFGFLVWLPTLLHKAGFTAVESAQYAFILNAVAIPAAFLTAWLFERWSTRWTLTIYLLVAGALMLVFGGLASAGRLTPALLILTGAVIFATGAALAGLFPPYALEVFPTELRATGTGWATSFSLLGAISGPLVGGAALSAGLSTFGQTAIFGGALILPVLAMLFWGIETRRRRLEEIAA
jgi:putative MFS transporter